VIRLSTGSSLRRPSPTVRNHRTAVRLGSDSVSAMRRISQEEASVPDRTPIPARPRHTATWSSRHWDLGSALSPPSLSCIASKARDTIRPETTRDALPFPPCFLCETARLTPRALVSPARSGFGAPRSRRSSRSTRARPPASASSTCWASLQSSRRTCAVPVFLDRINAVRQRTK
jgi:hypothetical protein